MSPHTTTKHIVTLLSAQLLAPLAALHAADAPDAEYRQAFYKGRRAEELHGGGSVDGQHEK